MGKILTEDKIEKAVIEKMGKVGSYNFINGYGEYDVSRTKENIQLLGPRGTGRKNLKELVLPDLLFSSLKTLNPGIPIQILENQVNELRVTLISKDLKILIMRTIK